MVIEAIDKETGAKWAIKKVNKDKVRLSVCHSQGAVPGWLTVQLPSEPIVLSLEARTGPIAGEVWGLL